MNKKGTAAVPGIILLIAAIVTLGACGSSRHAIGVEEGWELLSTRKVNFVRDHDEIKVENRNMFTAIRFQVQDRDVRINDLKIYFQNGDKLEPKIDDVIGANQSSREIELARDGRSVDRIEFRYHTTGSVLKGRATVLVFGRKYYAGY